MLNTLIVFFLVFTSFHCFAHEQKASPQEQLLCPLENLKFMADVYANAPPDLRKRIISQSGLPESEINNMITMGQLDWKMEGEYKLPLSNSKISLPKGYAIVTGSHANAINITQGLPIDESQEAYVILTKDINHCILFESYKIGYIPLNELCKLNPQEVLNEIIRDTEELNKIQRKNGSIEVGTTRWIQEPRLDKNDNTVYWTVEANTNIGNMVNSVAIRLGREGFEKITLSTIKSRYTPSEGHLDTMVRAHSFDPGYQYQDYKPGDKVAKLDIAILVGSSLRKKIDK